MNFGKSDVPNLNSSRLGKSEQNYLGVVVQSSSFYKWWNRHHTVLVLLHHCLVFKEWWIHHKILVLLKGWQILYHIILVLLRGWQIQHQIITVLLHNCLLLQIIILTMRYSGFVYPYPSSVNVANFVKITLSSKNFLAWESQMINMIETFDLMELFQCPCLMC